MKKHPNNPIWHPFTPLVGSGEPIRIKSANGIYLRTEDGKTIIDAVSSWWVNLHGHANKEIGDAIWKQSQVLEHVIFAGFSHEPAETLANNLLEILPDSQTKIFFSDNGSTAVEVAIKMAIQYWSNLGKPKRKLVAIEGAYHGDTFGAMSAGERGMFTQPFNSFLFDVDFIPFPAEEREDETIQKMQHLLEQRDVAAFIYEPLVQGAAGMRIYRAEILEQLITIAGKQDALCIADEVFTGFCRTGKYFASHYMKQQPDIMAISKGITGGFLPLGVTSCNDRVLDAFRTSDVYKAFYHGHSYTANPLCCAAANKSYELLTRPECQNRIRSIEDQQHKFANRVRTHQRVATAKSLGTVLSIELKTGEETSYTNNIRTTIYNHFLSKGILLRPLGNVIYVLPPYVITDKELEHIHTEISEFLDLL